MVHIAQPEALELLAAMEGGRWRRTQEERRHDPYGFFFWLRAWSAKLAAGLRDVPVPLSSFAERATRGPVIYGAEGYHLYRIEPSGELVLARHSALPSEVERARALGFQVT